MRVRMQIYNSTVLAVLLYRCEAWALTDHQLQRISVFHNHCLRAILHIHHADAVPRTELRRRCGTVDAASLIAQRQLRWLGHVGRMSDERAARQALYITGVGERGHRRHGAPASRLAEHYSKLVSALLPTARICELLHAGAAARGQRNWLSVCKDRELWHAECARFRIVNTLPTPPPPQPSQRHQHPPISTDPPCSTAHTSTTPLTVCCPPHVCTTRRRMPQGYHPR